MSDLYRPPIPPDVLYHYGIAGRSGRYPLGSGDRPYQRKNKNGLIRRFEEKKKTRQQEKARAKREKELREEQEAEEARIRKEQRKAGVLRSGKASEVLLYKGDLSNKELQDVVNRLDLEEKLRNHSAKETQRALDKMDKIMKDVDKIVNWGQTATKGWNLFAGAYNASLGEDSDGKKLKFIKTG